MIYFMTAMPQRCSIAACVWVYIYTSLKEFKNLSEAITAKQELTELEKSAQVALSDYESRKRIAIAFLRVSAPQASPAPTRAKKV